MRFAVIKNGIVENTIEASPEFIQESGIEGVFSESASVGDLYSEGTFTKSLIGELFQFRPVKPMYFRIALLQLGLLETIEEGLTGASKVAFEYALQLERYDAMILEAVVSFGLSDNQIDDVFKLALSLQDS